MLIFFWQRIRDTHRVKTVIQTKFFYQVFCEFNQILSKLSKKKNGEMWYWTNGDYLNTYQKSNKKMCS